MLPRADCLREVIEFLLRRTDPVARREQMLHPPCLTLWPVLSWDFQRWLDFIFHLLTIACVISLGAREGNERQRTDRNSQIIRMANPEKRKLVRDPRNTETFGIWTSKNITSTVPELRERTPGAM